MDFDVGKSISTYLTLTKQFPNVEFEHLQRFQGDRDDKLVHHVVKIDVVKLIDQDRKTSFH